MIATSQSPNLVDVYDETNPERYERASSERAQAALRTVLATHFHTNRRTWDIVTLCRQRIALPGGNSTICDICIVAADAPVERIIHTPPMICIDVISSEPLSFLQNRIDEIEKLGVKHIWLLDPTFRTGWRTTSTGLFQIRDDQMVISGTSIGLRLSAIFNEMDEMIRPGRRMSVSAALERNRNDMRH